MSDLKPSFARDFPDDPELSALVGAFARGDYVRVRAEAPKLAERTEDKSVRDAANQLRARTEADPIARVLLLFTLVLLFVLTAWWIAHDGPSSIVPSAPQAPRVERIN